MKKFVVPITAVCLAVLTVVFWSPLTQTIAQYDLPFVEKEPDIPEMLQRGKSSVPKEEFLTGRAEYFGLLRGLNKETEVDPTLRQVLLPAVRAV